MKLQGRHLVRRSVLAVSGLAMLVLSSPTSPAPAAAPSQDSIGELPLTAKGETRLRKLHLVRPDLIPYPIAFEVYC